ncbi:MAG: PD-(D/E)XK nuclease family protein [Vicingaceae bacterium]|nr:PD-(D/E)XK nuclease family protein [Vicingaceae bacterium]
MNLIENIKNLPEPKKTYLEVLEVHNKEVPIANLLAFFFRDKEIHGLKDLFIKSLLKTKFYELDVKNHPNSTGTLISLVSSEKEQEAILNSISNIKVKTEVKTSKDINDNKRIDILIDTDRFVICIEFKINHKLNNPLETYQNHIVNTYKNFTKHFFYIVLTPVKKEADIPNIKNYLEKNEIFKQVVFSHFIKNIQNEFPQNFKENSSFQYYNDFVQTVQNREIRHKRRLLLEKVNQSFLNKKIDSAYRNNSKGGFIQVNKHNYLFKIRIENKKFQIEKWITKKDKSILETPDLDTNFDEIIRIISNYTQIK